MTGMNKLLNINRFGLKKLTVILTAVGLLTACGQGTSSPEAAQNKAPAGYQPQQPQPSPAGQASPLIKSLTSNFAHPNYLPENVIDGNPATFMTTQGSLANGDIRVIAIELEQKSLVKTMGLVNNYTNEYHLGDLEISVSEDSTNGFDGSWSVVTSVNANNNAFTYGDGLLQINRQNVKWVKLRMLYSGTGAYGPATPAFYLSEVILQ